MQTRKQFLINSLSLTSGISLFGTKAFSRPQKNPLASSYLSFDLHCHPGRLFVLESTGDGKYADANKTLNEMKASHLSGAFFTLVADNKIIKLGPTGVSVSDHFKPGEAWGDYKKQLKIFKDFFQVNTVHESTNADDLHKSGPLAAYLAIEGGDFLEGKVEKLDEAYEDGIRSIQLVHYAPNDLGDLQTSEPMHNGLSAFGKDVVRKMNKLGIVIDVAHATYQTAKDAASLSDSPIMLSHSILEMEPDRPIAKRAISKDHAKAIAATGGLIGMWPSGFNKSFEEYVDNTMRMVDVVGIDHVGIGTDMDSNFKPVLSSYAQFPAFAEALTQKGLSDKEVEKIMGGNAAGLLKKVFKQK
jgi:membrane dipeptidase